MIEVKKFRYLEKSGLFPPLNTGISLAVFISLGHVPEENESLHNIMNVYVITILIMIGFP